MKKPSPLQRWRVCRALELTCVIYLQEEHSVENLQFIVWYRSYCERFNALAPEYQVSTSRWLESVAESLSAAT